MAHKTMHFVILLLASLALGLTETDAGRPSNVRQFDKLPNLAEALNVAKSPYEPVTLAAGSPSNVARTNLEPLATTQSKLTPEEENLRTTRSAEQPPEEEKAEQASSPTTKSPEDGASSGAEASSTQSSPDESSSQTEAPQEESTPTTTETDEVSKGELPTTTSTSTTAAPEPVSSESASSTTQEPSEPTTEAETPSSSSEGPPSGGSAAPKEQEETSTTREPETTTTLSETTTTTTAAPETTQPATEATEAAPETTAAPPGSGLLDSAGNDQPKEQPVVELSVTTSAPDLVSSTSSEPPSTTEEPASSSQADVEREQQQPTTTTTSTTPAASTTEDTTPISSQSPSGSTEAPKLESSKPKEEVDKSSCDHLPTYSSDEIQKVFREETTFRNGTIKGKFTYINFDQRYRLVHYTRLPYGPVKIDRVEELGKPGSSGDHPSSSSPGDVLQLRNLLPNSLFGFPFLGPHAAANRPAFANRHEDPNTYFYSTDSLSPGADPHPLEAHSHSPSAPRSHTANHPAGQQPTSASAHQDVYRQAADIYSKQLNRLEGPGSEPFPAAARTGHHFQYSNPFQGQSLSSSSESPSNKGFSYSYFTSHSDYQPASQFQQPWASPIYPAYPLRIGHQLSDHQENGYSRGHHHHQPHSHEHYEAPFMFSQTGGEPIRPKAVSDGDSNNPRLKLQVKTSKALNLSDGQTKSAQLRLQPSNGHYSHLSSPSQMYQRNQQRQRLGKQSQQRHRSLMSASNQVPVIYHVLSSPYNRRQFNQGHVMAYDQADE